MTAPCPDSAIRVFAGQFGRRMIVGNVNRVVRRVDRREVAAIRQGAHNGRPSIVVCAAPVIHEPTLILGPLSDSVP